MKMRKFSHKVSAKIMSIEHNFLGKLFLFRKGTAAEALAYKAMESADCSGFEDEYPEILYEIKDGISDLKDDISDLKDEISGCNEESLTDAWNN